MIYLALEARASEPWTRFVALRPEEAQQMQALLFDQKAAEFAPPFGRVLLVDGQVAGMVACLSGSDLRRARLRGAVALSRGGFLKQNPDIREAMRLASTTLLQVEDGDFYLSRIAVSAEVQGRGFGDILMGFFDAEAAASSLDRAVLEVSPSNHSARNLYRRHGFQDLRGVRASDQTSGKVIEYLHMSKDLRHHRLQTGGLPQ
jgi:ribosomal protein S18 acetylase RimI-like enzyme